MKKALNIFLAVLITFFAFPVSGLQTVAAEGKVYKDGTYSLPVGFYKFDAPEETSGANNFIEKTAQLVVNNGNYTVDITLKSGDAWHEFKVKSGNDFVDVQTVSENPEDNTRVVRFQVEDLEQPIHGKIHIIMGAYNEKYDIYIKFDASNIPLKDEEENTDGGGEGPGDGGNPDYEPAEDTRVVGNLITENEAEDVYEVNYDTGSQATKTYLLNPVKILVKDNDQYVQIQIKDSGVKFFKSLKFNGEEVIWSSTTEAPYVIQYKLKNGIDDTINVSMVIDTGFSVMPHDNISLWFDTKTLKMTKVSDKRVTSGFIAEASADSVEEYEYATDSNSTARQLLNPVKVLTKNGDKYLQIPISASGAGYFKSLKFNGEEVVWNSITNEPYYVQYKIPNDKTIWDKIDVSMIIDTPFGIMPHDNIKLWLENRINKIDFGQQTNVAPKDKLVLGTSGNYVKMPDNLPNNVKVKVTPQTDVIKKFKLNGDLDLAGEVYEFEFEGLEGFTGDFQLELAYDEAKYPTTKYKIDIYYYDPVKQEWIPQNGQVKDGKVIAVVNHFSTYGVFATQKPIDPTNLAEGYYKIDYKFLKSGTNDPSTTQGFTEGPAYIKVDNKGNIFVALTFTSADMIEYLEVNGTKATTLIEDKAQNKRVVEFKVNDITNKIAAKIKVNVPGFYNQEHDVDLEFDLDTIEAIDASQYPTKGSGTIPAPSKPANNAKDKDAKSGDKATKKAQSANKMKPDKVSTFDYVIYKADADEPSAANQFFAKPGYLLEKDGKKFIQLKINGWNYINWLKLKATNKDVDVVEVNGNTALIQFPFNGNLSEAIWLVMNLTVPGVYDGETYEARLVIDPDSLTEVDPEGYFIYQDVEKPSDFGTASKAEGDKKKQSGNPKTGDTSQVWFFTMLLIVSMIPLVINLRRRFA